MRIWIDSPGDDDGGRFPCRAVVDIVAGPPIEDDDAIREQLRGLLREAFSQFFDDSVEVLFQDEDIEIPF
jgi:hypothetical protein